MGFDESFGIPSAEDALEEIRSEDPWLFPKPKHADDDLYGAPGEVLQRVIDATRSIQPQVGIDVPEMYGDATYYRELPNGRCIVLYPLIMGTVRITVSDIGSPTLDDAWCYSVPGAGLLAAMCWDGEGDPPEGWFRHIGSARRRPEGDPEREYIAR
jgi:hypothetical protein